MNKTFHFNGDDLRHVEIDGVSWFVAADVCRILDLCMTGGTQTAMRALRDDEKRVLTRAILSKDRILEEGFFKRRESKLSAITESGLYMLVMRSDKATAAPFQDWVTREVLPAIRKTGGYLLNEAARETAHADERTEIAASERSNRLTLTLG